MATNHYNAKCWLTNTVVFQREYNNYFAKHSEYLYYHIDNNSTVYWNQYIFKVYI